MRNSIALLFEDTQVIIEQLESIEDQCKIFHVIEAAKILLDIFRYKKAYIERKMEVKESWSTIHAFLKKSDLKRIYDPALILEIQWTFTKIDSELVTLGLIP